MNKNGALKTCLNFDIPPTRGKVHAVRLILADNRNERAFVFGGGMVFLSDMTFSGFL